MNEEKRTVRACSVSRSINIVKFIIRDIQAVAVSLRLLVGQRTFWQH